MSKSNASETKFGNKSKQKIVELHLQNSNSMLKSILQKLQDLCHLLGANGGKYTVYISIKLTYKFLTSQ